MNPSDMDFLNITGITGHESTDVKPHFFQAMDPDLFDSRHLDGSNLVRFCWGEEAFTKRVGEAFLRNHHLTPPKFNMEPRNDGFQ